VSDLGGWPALVRLRLARRDGAAWQFPREEVLAELSERQTTALFALALVGTAGVDLVSEIAGFPCDLDDLAEHVPLGRRVDEERFHAHELWAGIIAATRSSGPCGLRRHAVQTLIARDDLERAGSVAVAGKDGRSSPRWRNGSSRRPCPGTRTASAADGWRHCRRRSARGPDWSC
jgi:hypothetical protein